VVPGGSSCSRLADKLVFRRLAPVVRVLQVPFATVVRFGLVWERRNLTGK
jgi:hypothetical protein